MMPAQGHRSSSVHLGGGSWDFTEGARPAAPGFSQQDDRDQEKQGSQAQADLSLHRRTPSGRRCGRRGIRADAPVWLLTSQSAVSL